MPETLKIVVCIPTAGMVPIEFAISVAGMLLKTTSGVPTRPEATIFLSMNTNVSSVIHSNREMGVASALEQGATHVLFLDDDMQFEPNILEVLLGRRQPVVAVNYAIKKKPIEFVAVGLDGRRIVTHEKSTGLQEIQYTGFGVSLFEAHVFRKVPHPWFQPRYVPDAGCYTTEDLPFYEKVREAGIPCYVDHDASKLVTGHVGRHVYSWREWVRATPEPKPTETSTENDHASHEQIPRVLNAGDPHRERGVPGGGGDQPVNGRVHGALVN
jgi:hypothetical protein